MGCTTPSWEFYPGEGKNLDVQVFTYNKATDCKEPLAIQTGDTVEMEIPALPNNIIVDKVSTPAVTMVDQTMGKITVALTTTQTATMTSGSLIVRINKAGAAKFAVAVQGITKLVIPGC